MIAAAARVALLVALLGAACDAGISERDTFPTRSPQTTPGDPDAVLIGLVGTSSGPESWRGDDAFEGADLAVHEIARGIQPAVELVTRDDGGDPVAALQAVAELAGDERMAGIVYAGPPQALTEVEPILADAGIPLIVCYADLYGQRRLSPHVFQAGPSYVWEARRIADYLLTDRRYRSVGLLARSGTMGATAADTLRSALRLYGGGAPAVETFPDSGSPEEQLRRLRAARVEAIVVEGDPAQVEATARALRAMDATYRGTARARIASAPNRRAARRNARAWRPQIALFDLGITPLVDAALLPEGTVAAETYARGVHYLPVPSFARFRGAFEAWWDGEQPLGWEVRAYDATRLIGWTIRRAEGGSGLTAAELIERSFPAGKRFGSLPVTLGPDDHTMVDEVRVGLWVLPRGGIAVRERERLPASLPWVPLARGFSIDGRNTSVAPEDWRHLFRGPTAPQGPAPKLSRSRFGVATSRKDPVH